MTEVMGAEKSDKDPEGWKEVEKWQLLLPNRMSYSSTRSDWSRTTVATTALSGTRTAATETKQNAATRSAAAALPIGLIL